MGLPSRPCLAMFATTKAGLTAGTTTTYTTANTVQFCVKARRPASRPSPTARRPRPTAPPVPLSAIAAGYGSVFCLRFLT